MRALKRQVSIHALAQALILLVGITVYGKFEVAIFDKNSNSTFDLEQGLKDLLIAGEALCKYCVLCNSTICNTTCDNPKQCMFQEEMCKEKGHCTITCEWCQTRENFNSSIMCGNTTAPCSLKCSCPENETIDCKCKIQVVEYLLGRDISITLNTEPILIDLISAGLSEKILLKVESYMEKLKKAPRTINTEKLTAKKLHLNKKEERAFIRAIVEKSTETAADFGRKMSETGREILVSIRLWLGSLANIERTDMFARQDEWGNIKNALWEAIRSKNATDETLREVLQKEQEMYPQDDPNYVRLGNEIQKLQ